MRANLIQTVHTAGAIHKLGVPISLVLPRGKPFEQPRRAIEAIGGDPTLDLRAKDPISVDETHARAIGRTFELVGMNPMYGENVSVTIHTGITNSPGTRVTVWKDADVYQVVEVDADGVAEIKHMVFSEPGEVSVSVTGPEVGGVAESSSRFSCCAL